MYNQEQKTKFIRSYTESIKTAQVAERLFNATEPFEESAGKDICTFSPEELQPVADEVFAMRSGSKWLPIAILQEYAKWCIAGAVPNAQDNIRKVNLLGLDKIKNGMVSGPAHLQKFLDAVYDPEKEETVDNIYRCFFWMAFCGIEENDIITVKRGDVDFQSMTVTVLDREYPFPREAIPAFRNAATLSTFNYKHPHYRTIRRDRAPGDEILRGIKALQEVHILRANASHTIAMARKAGLVSQALSYERVRLSGLFYRVYEQERAGIPPDFYTVAAQYMEGKEYSMPGSVTLKAIQNNKAKSYMDDYQRWKLAFSV